MTTTFEAFHPDEMIAQLLTLEAQYHTLPKLRQQRESIMERLTATQQELAALDTQIAQGDQATATLKTIWELARPVLRAPAIKEVASVVAEAPVPDASEPETDVAAETAAPAVQDASKTEPREAESSPETQPEPVAADPVDDDESRPNEEVAPPSETPELSDVERVFAYLQGHPHSIRKDIQAATGLSKHVVGKALSSLQEARRIRGEGEYPTFYSLARVGSGGKELTAQRTSAEQLAERNAADQAAVVNKPASERKLPPFHSPSTVTAELKAKTLLVLKDLGRPSSQTMIRNRVGADTRLSDLQAALTELATDGLVFQNDDNQWATA